MKSGEGVVSQKNFAPAVIHICTYALWYSQTKFKNNAIVYIHNVKIACTVKNLRRQEIKLMNILVVRVFRSNPAKIQCLLCWLKYIWHRNCNKSIKHNQFSLTAYHLTFQLLSESKNIFLSKISENIVTVCWI